ncbi:hypothetical protein [Paenibacillus typhae]|nr:hypothetical protein [Paenibacillus typhae]
MKLSDVHTLVAIRTLAALCAAKAGEIPHVQRITAFSTTKMA